jgi:NADPH:quinone reductase-like Zn-dependent oxidoreductase
MFAAIRLVMAEAELPEPGVGQVRVRVLAASLNYRDVFVISRFGDVGIDNRIPLSDASGAVDAIGDGATRFRLEDRVATIFFPDWISGRFRSRYARSAFDGAARPRLLTIRYVSYYCRDNNRFEVLVACHRPLWKSARVSAGKAN